MDAQKEIRQLADDTIAEHSLRFFKTAKGEYGHGDLFLGIRVPVLRKLAKKYKNLSLRDTKTCIKSKYHEERLFGLLVLMNAFEASGDEEERGRLYDIYVKHFKYINNWDLVDVTAPRMVGQYLINKERGILYQWAKSKDLWARRIAIVSTHWFIRKGDLRDVFCLAKILLNDKQDLIHKAVGWMLREAGKKDSARMERFLKRHYKEMPRTMLRYTIEKIPEKRRQSYLQGLV